MKRKIGARVLSILLASSLMGVLGCGGEVVAGNVSAGGGGKHLVFSDWLVHKFARNLPEVAGEVRAAMTDIAVNQVGYLPKQYKSATLRGEALNNTARLVDEEKNTVVFEAVIGEGLYDADTEEKEAVFDFSDVTAEGTYHIEAGEEISPSFMISEDAYSDAFRASMKMLYYQRCGNTLDEKYAGDFAHPACHTDKAVLYEDNSVSLNVSGGWHDAGDYGRYSVPGAKAAADILLAFEDYPDVFGDDLGIPESGNGVPDVLDEAKYELDWLFKMQRDDGGVYHKVTCSAFPGEIMPEDEKDLLYVMPVSTTSTGDFAGVMAIAARVFEKYDSAYSDKCLEAAEKAADYLDATPRDTEGFRNPADIYTGQYEDFCDVDERFWAYAELFKTTGDKIYEKKAAGEIPVHGYSLGWQGVGGYGAYAYLTAQAINWNVLEKVNANAQRVVSEIVDNADSNAYGSSVTGEYPWGSNMSIANNGEFLLMMDKDETKDHKDTVEKQIGYLFGNNANGYSFLTGFGTRFTEHPHHRPSQAVGKAVCGMLAGGPNSALNDPCAASLLQGTPRAKCYVDNDQSYSTNEVAIYWNSPLVYILAGEMAGADPDAE